MRAEATIDRVPTIVRSALDHGQPLEYAFPGYELRVVRADQTFSKLEVEMRYIVANRQAAVEFDWAEIQVFTADGAQENWSLSGCVSRYDDTLLEDGRYAFTVLISQVLRRPYDEFEIVQQRQLDWDELLERRGELNWDEAVTLKFQ